MTNPTSRRPQTSSHRVQVGRRQDSGSQNDPDGSVSLAPPGPHRGRQPTARVSKNRIGGQRESRYNSRIVRATLVMLAVLCSAFHCIAQVSNGLAQSAVSEFAARIVSLAGPGTASLTTKNASSATAEQFAVFRKTLQRSLQEAGVRLRQSPQAASEIRVTLSENVRGLVYLAEVQQGSETRVTMMEALPAAVIIATPAASTMSLRRTLLVSREEPVLDATLMRMGSESKLAVLTSQAVVLYHQQDSGTRKSARESPTLNLFPSIFAAAWCQSASALSMPTCREPCAQSPW